MKEGFGENDEALRQHQIGFVFQRHRHGFIVACEVKSSVCRKAGEPLCGGVGDARAQRRSEAFFGAKRHADTEHLAELPGHALGGRKAHVLDELGVGFRELLERRAVLAFQTPPCPCDEQHRPREHECREGEADAPMESGGGHEVWKLSQSTEEAKRCLRRVDHPRWVDRVRPSDSSGWANAVLIALSIESPDALEALCHKERTAFERPWHGDCHRGALAAKSLRFDTSS